MCPVCGKLGQPSCGEDTLEAVCERCGAELLTSWELRLVVKDLEEEENHVECKGLGTETPSP